MSTYVALLNGTPEIKTALFTELPPGGKLTPLRDPFAGSLRYHLGLVTPNSNDCYIEVDGSRYSWRDGQGVMFDKTYIHEAHNQTYTKRIILFCDVTCPLKWPWANQLNHWLGAKIMSAASSPNSDTDSIGLINRFTHWWWVVEQKRRTFNCANRTLYKAIKLSFLVL